MENLIENKTFDEERALYNLKDTEVKNCIFAGKQDGESVLKESRNIIVNNCSFSLRYPLWHVQKYELKSSTLDDKTRAPIWYSNNGIIEKCNITGIKTLRECTNTKIENSEIDSKEFGWKCSDIEIQNTNIISEYIFLDSKNVKLDNVKFQGKYSFQYMENLEIRNSVLDTKDAFWHSKNVTVRDSIVKGEYLAWFSDNLTLINCKIIGTQPLCYCTNLKLINCEMEDTDLAFEYSEVEADIKGNVLSIKNPKSGTITVDSVGEIINEDSIMEVNGKIVIRGEANEKKLRMLIDIAMTILFVILMGYHITGNKLHEILGVVTFVLFIIHNLLNIKWYRSVFKGKYSFQRVFHTIINLLLFVAMIGMMVSGIMISSEVFRFLNLTTTGFARELHMLSTSWGFVLMSIHVGLHINNMMMKISKKMKNNTFEYVYYFILLLLIGYGIYSFVSAELWKDMFVINKFKFFDYDQNPIVFYLGQIGITISISLIVYYMLTIVRNIKNRKKGELKK